MMLTEYTHKINARLDLVRASQRDALRVRIRRVRDGFYFNPATRNFVDSTAPGFALSIEDFWLPFESFFGDPSLKTRSIITLPQVVQDLIFEYQSFDFQAIPDPLDPTRTIEVPNPATFSTFFERHFFGGKPTSIEPDTCVIFGTLRDIASRPLSGQEVRAYLNRAGFFTHKAGLIGHAAHAITDAAGYFELPLVVGLDVTINVPIIGFTVRGFVPNLPSVELTSQALLSQNPAP